MAMNLQAKPASPKLLVEKKSTLSGTELEELCIATEDAIRDGIGFNWIAPPLREVLESYWNGVVMVPSRSLFVGKLDGIVAGSVQLLRPSKTKEMQAFAANVEAHFVAPWARGHGLAKMLLAEAEREAAKDGFSVINIAVRESQERALTIYREHGYTQWGTMPYFECVNASMVSGHFFYKKLEPISNLI
jgi:ribosomal protein S18 acetylase RimI-like enzyme